MRNVLIALLLSLACAVACDARVREYKLKVVKEYPHDAHAYTQGLFFDKGRLYESTGQYGESSFRLVELETGKVLKKISFLSKYFGEGSVILDGKLFILTWTNKVIFQYDAETLEYRKTYSWPREGWGITTDGSLLYVSDGSSDIYVLDSSLRLQRTIKVNSSGRPMRLLNELEWIDGMIWANVYTTDMIVVINPRNGNIESKIDCSGLLPRKLMNGDTDVLNGIAYDSASKKIYLTGKNWPRLYEVELVGK